MKTIGIVTGCFNEGLIAGIGLPYKTVPFHQPRRKHGATRNNFYTLYDMAMPGIANLSKMPLRQVTFSGFARAVLSVPTGLAYFVYRLLYWNRFSEGMAPLERERVNFEFEPALPMAEPVAPVEETTHG